jgi:hypothetical protein
VKYQTVWNAQKNVECKGTKILSNLMQFIFLCEKNILFVVNRAAFLYCSALFS